MVNEFTLGQIVRSKAGRDKGLFMVVVGFCGDEFVLLADGRVRKVNKPKKKKIKHISKTNVVSGEAANAVSSGSQAADAEIRKILKRYNNPIESEGENTD